MRDYAPAVVRSWPPTRPLWSGVTTDSCSHLGGRQSLETVPNLHVSTTKHHKFAVGPLETDVKLLICGREKKPTCTLENQNFTLGPGGFEHPAALLPSADAFSPRRPCKRGACSTAATREFLIAAQVEAKIQIKAWNLAARFLKSFTRAASPTP